MGSVRIAPASQKVTPASSSCGRRSDAVQRVDDPEDVAFLVEDALVGAVGGGRVPRAAERAVGVVVVAVRLRSDRPDGNGDRDPPPYLTTATLRSRRLEDPSS